MIKVKVYDVGPPYPIHSAPLLCLTDEDEKKVLVLTIAPPEALAIKSQISDDIEPPPRPMTHDLLKSVLGHLKATVKSVVITELRNNQFYVAEIHVESHGESLTIDSRPSDAIALALRVDAPIYVLEEVMEEAGKEMPNQKDYDVVAATETTSDEMFNVIEKELNDTENPLESVRKQLEAAIEEERYEDAARLRDTIRKLEE